MRASEIAGLCPGKSKIKAGTNKVEVACPNCQPNGPKHKGNSPHLLIWDDEGWSHVKCIRDCSEAEILGAIGLTNDDRRHEERLPSFEMSAPKEPPKIVATDLKRISRGALATAEDQYDYLHPDGGYSSSKFRMPPKPGRGKFWQGEITPVDIIVGIGHLNGAADYLFNLPDVLAAIARGETIYINEGEKAVKREAQEGLTGTCQRHGAGPGKWLPCHTKWLTGAKLVVIVADRDPVGEAYAKEVAAALRLARIPTSVVQSKTENEHDDAFDHFEAGFGADQFVSRPDLLPQSRLSAAMVDAYEENPAPVEFILGAHIRKGQTCLISGDSGAAKSTAILSIAAGASNGWDVFGRCSCQPFRTLYFAGEDSTEDYGTIYAANGGRRGFLTHNPAPFVLDEIYCRDLEDEIMGGAYPLVVFDPVIDYMAGASPSDGEKVAPFLQRLILVAMATNAAIVNIRHINKNSPWWLKDSGTGSLVWRSKHREHIMLGWRPGRQKGERGEVIMVPEKGSIRHQPGPAVSYVREGYNVTWSYDPDLSFMEEESAFKLPHKLGGAKQDARGFILDYLAGGAKLATDMVADAKKAGITFQTLRVARELLQDEGLTAWFRNPSGNGPYWYELTSQTLIDQSAYDPYNDN